MHSRGPDAVWRDGGADWRVLFIRGRIHRDEGMEPSWELATAQPACCVYLMLLPRSAYVNILA